MTRNSFVVERDRKHGEKPRLPVNIQARFWVSTWRSIMPHTLRFCRYCKPKCTVGERTTYGLPKSTGYQQRPAFGNQTCTLFNFKKGLQLFPERFSNSIKMQKEKGMLFLP